MLRKYQDTRNNIRTEKKQKSSFSNANDKTETQNNQHSSNLFLKLKTQDEQKLVSFRISGTSTGFSHKTMSVPDSECKIYLHKDKITDFGWNWKVIIQKVSTISEANLG